MNLPVTLDFHSVWYRDVLVHMTEKSELVWQGLMSTHLRVHICVSSNIRKTKANFYRSPYLTQKHKLLWRSLRRLKSSMQNLEKWHEINHLDSRASFDKWYNTLSSIQCDLVGLLVDRNILSSCRYYPNIVFWIIISSTQIDKILKYHTHYHGVVK